MADYDPETKRMLQKNGWPTYAGSTTQRSNKGLPYNAAGLAALRVLEMPRLEGTDAAGFMLSDPRVSKTESNRGLGQDMFVAPAEGAGTIGHEAEHLLARNSLGHPSSINEMFDKLVDNKKSRGEFVKNAVAAAPYLKQTYGIDDAYFDKSVLKQGGVGLYEQLASMAGTEAAKNVDLTKDPELRKTLFKDRAVREAYNAITGLRQTRLDPRDLPPYERLAEPTTPGAMDKLKKMIGYANGGPVDHAGNNKYI